MRRGAISSGPYSKVIDILRFTLALLEKDTYCSRCRGDGVQFMQIRAWIVRFQDESSRRCCI